MRFPTACGCGQSESWRESKTDSRYFVSDHGNILSLVRESSRLLKPGTSTNGRLRVTLGKITECIHILVLEAFISKRPVGLLGLHNNGDHLNNHLHNLRWGTYSDNVADAMKHGSMGKLTFSVVNEMRQSSLSNLELADMTGISSSVISRARAGHAWRDASTPALSRADQLRKQRAEVKACRVGHPWPEYRATSGINTYCKKCHAAYEAERMRKKKCATHG